MALLKSNTIIYGTANIQSVLTVGAVTPNTSVNTSTGSLIVIGGVGVSGNVYANGIYDNGVELYTFANGAFVQANNISSYANAQITITQGVDATQNTNISSAQLFANGAFTVANSSSSNTIVLQGIENAQNTNITSVFTQANASFNVANSALSNTGSTITVNGTSQLVVANTTASTSNSTGALVVAGGVGISGNVNIGRALNVTGNLVLGNSSFAFGNTTTGGMTMAPGAYYGLNSNYGAIWPVSVTPSGVNYSMLIGINDVLISATRVTLQGSGQNTFRVTTGSASNTSATSQGTTVLQQGIGVQGDSYFLNNVGIGGANASTSNTTGSLVVSGGIGISGNVYANGIYTNGLFYAANGNPISGGTSLAYTAATTPPASGNNKGDQWYNTATNVLYEWATDGTSYFWLDTISPVYSNTANVNIITSGNVNTNVVFANSVYIGTQNANSYIQSYIQQNTIHPLMFVGL